MTFAVHTWAAGRRHRGPARVRYPVTTRKPNPAAWRAALKLAGGDARRLRVSADGGAVVVTNQATR
jgi:hypothetical protein